MKQLEQKGIIQGYHARLDPFRVDVGIVLFAEVTLRAHGAADFECFDATVAALPQIVEASHVSGAFDYLIKVVVGDLPEWTKIGEKLTNEAGVERINSHVLLRKTKIFVGYPVSQN